MFVVATAGHVDHGKSTLIRALTGMEPDRWAEEKRRGLTIDLGFAWTELPSGGHVAFVDVPGHERFLGNMLAGLGPAPVVCFVVAVDEGWQAQSDDHRDAVAALGIEHGLLALTRADRAPERADDVLARARAELVGTGLRDAPAVVVSAVTGDGLDELRTTLDAVLAGVPAPDPATRVRLWIDRSFTINGVGTVATGTLTAGTLTAGDRLDLIGRSDPEALTVRGLQSSGSARSSLGPARRAAVNLRGIAAEAIHRGDVLVTPDAWPVVDVVDVRRTVGAPFDDAPLQLLAHIGTAAVPARLRSFDADHARLLLERRLPLQVGDRLALRAPGGRAVLAGAHVLDVAPPELRRRGDGARRAASLAQMTPEGDPLVEVVRRGAVRTEQLRRAGLRLPAEVPEQVREIGGWWVHAPVLERWRQRLRDAVEDLTERDPLAAGLSRGAARDLLAPADDALLDAVVRDAELENDGGYLRFPGRRSRLGAAEEGVSAVERRLAAEPFAAPEAHDLADLKLGTRELAAAERAGRLLRLGDGIVLLPQAPARAMRELARLPQPFTTSQARQALGTSRRVVIPLLEHLDTRGWTRRINAGQRSVVR